MLMAELHPRARTAICPACGCSLVRLRVDRDRAVKIVHEDEELHVCCDGCAGVFAEDPDRLLTEIRDVVVCPGCLAEKPVAHTVELEHQGASVRLCRCPHCADAFRSDPDHLLQRLAF
jgi:formate dehydrogenase maturation protein FdhE